MIVIFKEDKDESIKKVSKWLQKLNIQFLLIDEEMSIDIVDFVTLNNSITDIQLKVGDEKYSLSDFKVVWFRRGHFQFKIPTLENFSYLDQGLRDSIFKHLNSEISTLNEFIYHYLKYNSIVINFPQNYNLNKLIGLDVAKKCGFKIPATIIARDKQHLLNFGNKNLLTKNIQDAFSYSDTENKISWFNSTKYVNYSELPSRFYFSLFQEVVNKAIEIRTFIFGSSIYSVAMYTQSNSGSVEDSRLFNQEKPIRIEAISLPDDINRQIMAFMKNTDLFTGSIDFIFDGDNFWFLEINPVGQFDFVSGNGNYTIEKDIALTLQKLHNEN